MLDCGKRIIKSKYLVHIKVDEQYYLLYNSLYGNLIKVNNESLKFLNMLTDDSKEDIESLSEKKMNIYFLFREKCLICLEGENEREWIEKQLLKRPEDLARGALISNIQLSVSNKCNMNCKYCFEKKFDNNKRIWNTEMNFDVAKLAIEKVLLLAEENDRKHITINFFGGEPLTNKKLILRILDYFGNTKRSNVRINYSIDTNGILIDEEIANKFREYDVFVNLSIDYYSQTEMYRSSGAVGSKFSEFDRKVSLLQKNGVKTYFLTVLSSDTFEMFNTRLLDYAKEKNVLGDDVIISFDLDFRNKHTPEEIVDILLKYYKYGRQIGIHVGGYWGTIVEQIIGCKDIRTREGYKSCPAIGNRLSIEPNGDIFACKSSSRLFGNIGNLEEVLNTSGYQDYGMRAYRNSESCEDCIIEGFCSGSCLGMLEQQNNSFNIRKMDEYLCKIYKKLVIEVLKVQCCNS